MNAAAVEVNFDGLIGPTHNYAGLAWGNLASEKNKLRVSYPRQAALQGLAKMKFLAGLGVRQAIIPPQRRPDLATMRAVGFSGSDAAVIERAAREAPRLLAACYSASSMWAANAATVSPGADAADGRVHFTPANLVTQFHRSLETPATSVMLRQIFAGDECFAHHAPLPANPLLADEGAANHLRLCASHAEPGIELFVYGRSGFERSADASRFPARQTLEASSAIARLHGLPAESTLFIRQNPAAIDAGAFHNDVVAVANENVLLFHASAFHQPDALLEPLREKFSARCGGRLYLLPVAEEELTLTEAVATYLFNSQIVTLSGGGMAMIAPTEARDNPRSRAVIDRLLAADNPLNAVHFVDVRQSMSNGGGPACLRLRVVMTETQLQALRAGVMLTEELHQRLERWIVGHYRQSLSPDDLADPALCVETRAAMDELDAILAVGS